METIKKETKKLFGILLVTTLCDVNILFERLDLM